MIRITMTMIITILVTMIIGIIMMKLVITSTNNDITIVTIMKQ